MPVETPTEMPQKTRRKPRQNGNAGRRRQPRGERPRSEHSKLYSHFTPAYEMLFPLLVKKRIWNAIKELQLADGAKVLEVGVGTGTSLPAYPRHADVLGIDLSTDMLAIAEKKIQENGWSNIHVQTGNAESLDFEDESFDCVTTFHTVSVVSNPDAMMREIVRVVRPGGKVLVINHFRSPRPWLANMIDCADPVTRHLGWRTDLAAEAIVKNYPLEVERQYKTSPLSLFTVVKATRRKAT